MNINQSQTEIRRVRNEKVKGPAGSVGSLMTMCRTGSQSTVHRSRWSWFSLLQVRSDWAQSKLRGESTVGTKHTVYETEERLRIVLRSHAPQMVPFPKFGSRSSDFGELLKS